MYLRHRTRAAIAAFALLVLSALLITLVFYLPAAPSSALGKVDLPLPETTLVSISGTAVAQLPPPPSASYRPAASAAPAPTTSTTVTLTDTLRERQPFVAATHPSLQAELGIPAAEIAALRPELSEHRVYREGEQPLVGPTPSSRELARRYLQALNALRERQGLGALRWDDDLALRAEGHATTRLWYFLLDGGQRVSGPRAAQLDAFWGIGRAPRYAPIGLSSHGLPTTLLVDRSDVAAVTQSLADASGTPLYGAATLPVTRVGVGIALAQNGTAPVPHGWLTILFQ